MDFKQPALTIMPGVSLDDTPSSIPNYSDSHWMRFVRGFPENVNGVMFKPFDGDKTKQPIENAPFRVVYSQFYDKRLRYLYGASTGLYFANTVSSDFTNITPISSASPTAVASSLATEYVTAGSNPVSTVTGSADVDIDVGAATYIEVGDSVTIAGVAGTIGGVAAASINGVQIVRAKAGNVITITVASAASGTASGGGASVIISTKNLVMTATAHTARDFERIKVAGAADTGGILAASINKEHIIKTVATNIIVFQTGTYATSAVSGGGGASTTYVKQVDDGAVDAAAGIGFGMANYGEGDYGGSPVASSINVQPRLWFFAPFGDKVLLTYGEGSKIYEWDFDTTAAPTALTDPDAPTDVDYIFTTAAGFAVALRGNIVQWCDVGDYTEWTQNELTFARQETVHRAGDLVSHIEMRGGMILLWSDSEVYTMRYNGVQSRVYLIKYLSEGGIAAPYARAGANGKVYWLSKAKKFYKYDGTVSEIPCPLRQYVIDNINEAQIRKSFAWFNDKYNEIWFHFPNKNATSDSRKVEPWEIIRLSLDDERSFSIDKSDNAVKGFTAAEQVRLGQDHITASFTYPVCMENGTAITDEDGTANLLKAYIETRFFAPYSSATIVRSVIPDSVQTGNVEVSIFANQYPQTEPPEISYTNLVVTPTTKKVMFENAVENRYWKYRIDIQRTSSTSGGKWRAGQWKEEISGGAPAN